MSGAASVKHFSRYYAFLRGPLYQARWKLWAHVIRVAASLAPADAVITIVFDDGTVKKSGSHIEGGERYRNGAGTARQAYRTLWGLNLVLAIMRVPLKRWPGHFLSVPIGLELYLKHEQAHKLKVPYQSRSQLARNILDFATEQLPGRHIRAVADGEYATKVFLRGLSACVDVISRFLISAKLFDFPLKPIKRGRGAPRKKGQLIGSPTTLAQIRTGWLPHPTEAGALVQAWCGLWHSVLPGHPIRVVVVRRPRLQATGSPTGKKAFGRLKPFEAFFTTDLSLSLDEILEHYEGRWAIEITIRDAHAFYALAQDQCRKLRHIVGANTFRLVMAAVRTLWFIDQADKADSVNLRRFRPWYRQKVAPSQLDIAGSLAFPLVSNFN